MTLFGSRGRSLVAFAAVGTGVLVGGGQLLAQTAPSAPQPAVPGFLTSMDDQVSPRFVQGANGEVYRFWQRRADERTGGGAIILTSAAGDNWQPVIELRSSEAGVTVRDPELAVSPANRLALIYRWWRNTPRSKQLRLARSDDGGKTWSLPEQAIDTSGKTFDPNITWGRDKTLVAVWSDERRDNRVFDVYVRRSPDGGVTWEPERVLSEFPEKLITDAFVRPRLVSDGQDRYWVVWMGIKNGRSSIYMNRSSDGGRTWTDPLALTGASQSVFGHSLQRAGDRLLLVWHDTRTGRDRIYAVASSDAGVTWTAPVRVDHLPDSAEVSATSPTVLLNPDGEALVAWQDARNGRDDIFVARSADGGRTWRSEESRMDADEPGTGVSRYPMLARARDGRIALAWEDDRDGLEDVYLRVRSSGDRAQWGPEIRVTTSPPKLAARVPQLVWASDDALYVAWEVWDHTLGGTRIAKRVETKLLRVDNRAK